MTSWEQWHKENPSPADRITALKAENAALLLERNELLGHYQRTTAKVLSLEAKNAAIIRRVLEIVEGLADAIHTEFPEEASK